MLEMAMENVKGLTDALDNMTKQLADVPHEMYQEMDQWQTEDVHSLVFSSDGQTLASGSLNGGITLWDRATGRPRAALPMGLGCITGLAFAPNGRTLAWNPSAACLTLWDVDRGQVRATLRCRSKGIRSVAFAPDGQTLASGGSDASVRLWDPSRPITPRDPP